MADMDKGRASGVRDAKASIIGGASLLFYR